ncbi:MAG: DUF2059 domain-containing protein [candidate division NC10 bacterium]|jgi:hypothetical protein
MVGWTLRVMVVVIAALVGNAGSAAAALAPVPGGAAPASRAERPSAATTAAVDELLELSGLTIQLEAISAGIRVQFLGAQAGLSAQDRAVIDRIAARHFSAEMLYARMRRDLERSLDAGRLEGALAWYRSPLGRRIARAEVAAIASVGEEAPVPWPWEARIELIERLEASGGAAETAVDVALAIVRSLTRVLEPFRPAHLRQTPDQLEDRIARVRTEALAPIRIACLQNMLFAYRGLDDAELVEYVRFMESAAGQWYAATMNDALVSAVGVAAELAAVEVVTLLPQPSGGLR